MTAERNCLGLAAIFAATSAVTLLLGPAAASADELADLRASQANLQANQELLQQRIDQLSQAPPGAPGPPVTGMPPGFACVSGPNPGT